MHRKEEGEENRAALLSPCKALFRNNATGPPSPIAVSHSRRLHGFSTSCSPLPPPCEMKESGIKTPLKQ